MEKGPSPFHKAWLWYHYQHKVAIHLGLELSLDNNHIRAGVVVSRRAGFITSY